MPMNASVVTGWPGIPHRLAAPPEHEQAGGREREEDEIDRHHVSKQHLVGPEQGRAVAIVPCSTMATTGTRVRGLTRATLRRNAPSSAIAKYTRGAVRMLWLRKPSDDRAHPAAISAAPLVPKHPGGDVHRRRRALLESGLSQHPDAGEGHADVERDHATDARHQRAGQVARRVLHLPGDEAGGLEAAVREEHRDQGREETRAALRGHRRAGRFAGESTGDQHREGRDLQHHQRALAPRSRHHAQAVDQGQRRHRQRRQRALRQREAGELAEVAREGHRAHRHSTGLDHQQECPSVEEADRGMERLAQVDVLPAGEGALPREARVDERAEQRRRPAHDPRPIILPEPDVALATMAGVTKMPEPTMPFITTMVASNRPIRRASPVTPSLYHGACRRHPARHASPRRPRPARTKNTCPPAPAIDSG